MYAGSNRIDDKAPYLAFAFAALQRPVGEDQGAEAAPQQPHQHHPTHSWTIILQLHSILRWIYSIIYFKFYTFIVMDEVYSHSYDQPYYYLSTYYICSVLNSMSPSYITELLRYIEYFPSFYLSALLFVCLFICLIASLLFLYLWIYSLLWTVCPRYI